MRLVKNGHSAQPDIWKDIKLGSLILGDKNPMDFKKITDSFTPDQLPEDGIYMVDKPKGISSFGAVYALRKLLSETHGKKVKVGHCGTLDPIATGLLVLVSGKNTRRAMEFTKLDKVYEAEAILGSKSDSFDSEGKMEVVSKIEPVREKIEEALDKFLGKSLQIPPSFSAIKIGGKRAYKLAREGVEVKMRPREVEIFSIDLIDYEYPKVEFRVHVSSGTYIRSIINDLGDNLGTGAYMSELRRVQIGDFKLP